MVTKNSYLSIYFILYSIYSSSFNLNCACFDLLNYILIGEEWLDVYNVDCIHAQYFKLCKSIIYFFSFFLRCPHGKKKWSTCSKWPGKIFDLNNSYWAKTVFVREKKKAKQVDSNMIYSIVVSNYWNKNHMLFLP